jgi:hypothetical protein
MGFKISKITYEDTLNHTLQKYHKDNTKLFTFIDKILICKIVSHNYDSTISIIFDSNHILDKNNFSYKYYYKNFHKNNKNNIFNKNNINIVKLNVSCKSNKQKLNHNHKYFLVNSYNHINNTYFGIFYDDLSKIN